MLNIEHIQTKNPFDLSAELIIQRHRGGIRLVKPSAHTDIRNTIDHFNTLNASVYFVDADSTILSVNQGGAALNGLVNITDMNGKNVKHFLKDDFSERIFKHDQTVIQSEEIRVFEESGTRKDDGTIQSIAIRLPWYYDNKLIGIFGICSSVSISSLSNFAAVMGQLISSGLIGSNVIYAPNLTMSCNSKAYYSKREIEVISHIIKGKSTKQIATALFISKRTVEHHIENIKHKANCNTRYELIYKLTNISDEGCE